MNDEQINRIIHDLAEMIDCGLVCFLNPETMEHLDVPQDVFDSGDNKEFYEDDLNKIDTEWPSFIRIEPLDSFQGFRIMEDFTDEIIPIGKFKGQLLNVLSRKKPFANFKWLVEGSKYREKWFQFKIERKEEYVREILVQYLKERS
jgi:hypothetical protein